MNPTNVMVAQPPISAPPDAAQPETSANRAKSFSETTRVLLERYRDDNKLTLGELARQLDTNATQISKYLSRKPEGDVARIEANAEDVLKGAALRREVRDTLFETAVSRRLNTVCETIRKTNDVGLVHGRAGLGKSCGIGLYSATNPAAIVVTLTKWNAGAGGLEAAIFAAIETRSKRPGERRADWMVRRLAGSNRLLVIDNAHRLTAGGRQWLFDFHDATGVPIALVGNPELLDAIRLNDQQFSRIGLLREVKVDEAGVVAAQMLARHCPEHAEKLLDLATKVAGERGHLRALKKHLLLMPEFMDAARDDVRRAFQMAHTQLVSDYTLND